MQSSTEVLARRLLAGCNDSPVAAIREAAALIRREPARATEWRAAAAFIRGL